MSCVNLNYLLTLRARGADAEHLPFRNNVFDAIICISTLHYFSFPKTSLGEFSRALKKRGIFLYGDVTMHESDHDNFLDKIEKTISHAHGKYSRPSEMKKLIESCGIQVTKWKSFLTKNHITRSLKIKLNTLTLNHKFFMKK